MPPDGANHEPGGLVDVKSATGQFVARGYYNPRTDIAIRILTRDIDEAIDIDFFRRRIRSAVESRQVFDPNRTNAYRLVNSEGDGLPGLIVDRFLGERELVVQPLDPRLGKIKDISAAALMEGK